VPLLKLTKSDLKQGKIVRPGKYRGKITEIQTKPAKTDGSTNYIIVVVGQEGEAKDVRFQDLYSEKFLGRMRPLLEALGCQLPEEDDFQLDLDSLVNRDIGLSIDNELFEKRLRNRIQGYYPVS